MNRNIIKVIKNIISINNIENIFNIFYIKTPSNKNYLKFNKYKVLTIVTLTNLSMLTSCSSDWQCKAEKGFSCNSISQIDGEGNNKATKKHKKVKVNKNLLTNTVQNIKMDNLHPIRTEEKIGKILITPYIDVEGNLNSGKYIYIIDEKPEWRIR
jgi:hypothetical protein